MSAALTLRSPGGLWTGARKVLAVARLHALAQLAYPGETLTSTVFAALAMFTLTALWRAVAEHHDLVAMTGLNLPQLVWYLAFSEALALSFAIPWDGLDIDREIRSGDVAYRLARPQSYPLYHLGVGLGERLTRLMLRLPVHAVIAWVLVGWPGLSATAVGAALLAAGFAAVADLAWVLVFSFSSFWVEDSFGLHFLYRRCVFLLGGLLIPLDAYPLWIRRFAEALPFKAVLYGPARLFVQADAQGIWALLRTQLTMATAGFVLLGLIYRAGARRLAAHGG
jgi:ABC-2 type transport system permease protein